MVRFLVRFGLENTFEGDCQPLANVVSLARAKLMRVDVEGCRWLRVAGETLHPDDVGARADQMRDSRVSQVVE